MSDNQDKHETALKLAASYDEICDLIINNSLPVDPSLLTRIIETLSLLGYRQVVVETLKGYRVGGKVERLLPSARVSFFIDMVILLNRKLSTPRSLSYA